MKEQELLDLLKTDMEDIKNKYQDLDTKMQDLVNQSKQLQEVYNEYAIKKEQLRGEYTSLYNLQLKLTNSQTANTEKQSTQNSATTAKVKKEDKAKNAQNSTSLTAEELHKIATIEKQNKSVKESDIPDYLKDEYNKK